MLVRNYHAVFEPNDIEFHDPGDHDDGVQKAVERYLKDLERAHGKVVFDMMMGRGPQTPEGDAFIERELARQKKALARHEERMRPLMKVARRLAELAKR